MADSKKLFGDFPPVPRQKWEEKIQEDLKGAPYKKLITRTPEGIEVKPYYHAEDLKDLNYLETLPNQFPYLRSARIQLNDWEIREDIIVQNIKEANKKALNSLNKGATALAFFLNDDTDFIENDYKALMDDIFFECIYVHFITHRHSSAVLDFINNAIKEKEIAGDRIMGSVSFDPLGYMNQFGSLPDSLENNIKHLADNIRNYSSDLPFLKMLTINGEYVHNAGGSIVQELAVSLSQVAEYVDRLSDEGMSIDEIAPLFQFNFATGTSYFMEIAKNRAARVLFAKLIRAWEPEKERSFRIYIHNTTSEWNQTIYDPYVNMLRGTTESMSAVLGGSNSLSVTPFDKSFRETTPFSERIARNTQIILKEEAHLNKVVDPAGGAYYIENLTHSLIEESWKVFLEIEDQGGYYEALDKGYIQEMLKDTARERDMKIANRREVLLGTNQYPDSTETIHEDFKPEIAFDAGTSSEKTEFEKFEKYRGAMAFEDLRLRVERSGKIPLVFMLTYGHPVWRKARAGFASGFFACGGYNINENPGFKSVDEGMKAAKEAKADVIVLCSSDEEYLQMTREAVKSNEDALLVIAGYPKDSLDEIKSEGIEKFIHVKSNLLEELKAFNSELGIK
jgi:methylmalonyl-CoA mutase